MTVVIAWADDIHRVPEGKREAEQASRLESLNTFAALVFDRKLETVPGPTGKPALVFAPDEEGGWETATEPAILDEALGVLGFQLVESVPETEAK
jgi:hypothetical protein